MESFQDEIAEELEKYQEIENSQTKTTKCFNSVYFLHRGKSMSSGRIQMLKTILLKRCLKEHTDIRIVDKFSVDELPMYIIVDAHLSIEQVQECLNTNDNRNSHRDRGYNNVGASHRYELNQIGKFITEGSLLFVKPDWIVQLQENLHYEPTIDHYWSGMVELKRMSCRKRDHEYAISSDCDQGAMKKPQSETCNGDSSSKTILCASPQKLHLSDKNLHHNLSLAKCFEQISKLYQDCPLDHLKDEWRSYSYNMIAGRLKYLDFEVANNANSLDKLSKVQGFGPKVMKQCKEFLTTGTVALIHEFQRDPLRIGMKNMMKIWGVGPKKASELVHLGYTTIESVREGLKNNTLDLSDNAKVGVECYEDFQEKMTRDEVDLISQIVKNTFREKFRNAEIRTMGSYRRGSQQCGDVDILITHEEYVDCTPKGAVDELVEKLRRKGHITHHLTRVDTDISSSSLIKVSKYASYMGVFLSPTMAGKRRRIDIKFYPYREKAFAMLYFTGNGYFNRSMRLYSKRYKGLTLDDHGLFPTNQSGYSHNSDCRRVEAKTEKDVFDILGLVYREPHERDAFDAVQERNTTIPVILDSFEDGDKAIESKHQWIE